MERQTQILIGGAVLLLLGFAVYKQTQKSDALDQRTSKADLPEIKATDDVDKIDIHNEKGDIVLEKKGDKWVMTKPVSAAANQGNVTSALTNLKDIKVDEVIAKNADEDLKKQYELDAAKGVHIQTFKGGEKKFEATFGKQGGRGNMAMLPDQPGVYAVKGYSGWMYTRDAKEWRDKEIFKFDDANVTSFTITNSNGPFSFTKGGDKWAGTFKGKAIDKMDEQKVKDAVSAFKNLFAEDFGDGKPVSDTGLDAPAASIKLQLKDNAGTYELKIGKVSANESRYAQKAGDDTIFIVGSWPIGFMNSGVDKFQQPKDGGAPEGGAPRPGGPHGMPPGMGLPPGMGMPPGMAPPPQ